MARHRAHNGVDAPVTQRRADEGNERVRASERAARASLRDGPLVTHLAGGTVEIHDVRTVHGDDGLECLEVTTAPGGSGETHWRIFNPPQGVRRGGQVVEDPVAALAEVLAAHGGARGPKRRQR